MKNKFYYYTPVNNIVAVKTNIKGFSFSYGLAMPESTEHEYQKAIIKIELEQVKGNVEPEAGEKEKMGKFHYFNGYPDSGLIFYERSFFFKQKLQFKISGIDSNHIKVVVNKNYMKFVKHRFMNVHSMGYILTDIINLRLMHNGFAPLHSSGIAIKDEGFGIFAPPNTGKTLTAMTLCMDKSNGMEFFAEDLSLTDGEHFYSVPWTSTFRYYESVDSSKFSKFLNKLTDKVSVLELFSFGKTDPITEYVDEISHKSQVSGIYILDRGTEKVYDISADEAFFRINTLDRYEFNYMRAPTIIAYEYFNPKTDIEKAYAKEREILKEMIKTAKFVRVVCSDNALRYSELIKKDLKVNE